MIHMIATRPSAAARTRPLESSPRRVSQPSARRVPQPPLPRRRPLIPWRILPAILLMVSVAMLALTLLTPALPARERPFPLALPVVSWLTTGFHLALTLVALIAAGLLVLLPLLRPTHTRRFVPSAAWQHCYCFSGEGQMSAERITRFLCSHPGWEPVALPTRAVQPGAAIRSAWPLAASTMVA